MSNQYPKSIGEVIRELRQKNKMPLRRLAALLDLDQSTLSKIENNSRRANEKLIEKISRIFNVDERTLKIQLLSDRIIYDLKDKDFGLDVLKVAEKKLDYEKNNK
jgi:transcriptional regulator with XRE-family HTH domain